MFHSFFFQLQHAQPCRLWFLPRENVGSLETPFSMLSLYWTPIWYQLGSILPSKYPPKFMKNHENIDRKRLPIMQPFSLRFGTPKTSLLGPNLEPSWLSRRPKRPPRPPPRGLQIELPDRWLMVSSLSLLARWRGRSFAALWILNFDNIFKIKTNDKKQEKDR